MVLVYRRLLSPDYEASFDKSVQKRIRPGDTIWDVGANVGHYSVIFAKLAGPDGKVIAIEPSSSSLPALLALKEDHQTIQVENVALSNTDGEATFYLNEQGNSVVEGLSRASAGECARETRVQVMRGDTLAADAPPNLIKVDVEGFEMEVIEGLSQTLPDQRLHTVAIEVHFSTLAHRGHSDAPRWICDTLRANGFFVVWTDPSHIVASR
jgi:FkbM family methyltransferase